MSLFITTDLYIFILLLGVIIFSNLQIMISFQVQKCSLCYSLNPQLQPKLVYFKPDIDGASFFPAKKHSVLMKEFLPRSHCVLFSSFSLRPQRTSDLFLWLSWAVYPTLHLVNLPQGGRFLVGGVHYD